MYAIIADSGTQFYVEEGQELKVDFRKLEPGQQIEFTDVLMVGGSGEAKVGKPNVAGAKVTAKVIGPVREKKIHVGFYKKRKNYRLHKGHRQPMTAIKIEKITAG